MENVEKIFSPQTLSWAISRTKLGEKDLEKKIKVKEGTIGKWKSGEVAPSISQAKRLAERAFIAFPMLLLDTPPADTIQIPDFRTVEGKRLVEASPNLRDTIDYVTECQDWYRDYLKNGFSEPNGFVGSLLNYDDPEEAAKFISETLSIADLRKEANSRGAFISALTRKIEALGICVMRSGIVRVNTRRPLDPNEFRGFALSDDYAPFIFINSKDALAGQAFSLVHELVHIGKNDSGVSGGDRLVTGKESFANHVAGAVLIPKSELPDENEFKKIQEDDLIRKIDQLSRKLKVSSWAVLTRTRVLRRISEAQYRTALSQIKEQGRMQPKASGSADYYKSRGAALGRNFSRALISSVKSGAILYRDMWQLSGIKPKSIDKYAKEIAFTGA